MIEDPMKF